MVPGAPGAPRRATLRHAASRWAAVGALLAVMSAALVATAPRPAHADTTTGNPAAAAAGWLARQLVDGQRFETVFGPDVFWDQGLTIDAIFAFAPPVPPGGTPRRRSTGWTTRRSRTTTTATSTTIRPPRRRVRWPSWYWRPR